MNRMKCLVVLGMILGVSLSVYADRNKGWYVDGYMGYGETNVSDGYWDETGIVWGGNVGYNFTQNVALEGGFNYFPSTDYTTKNCFFDVAGKFILPMSNSFDLFSKVGLSMSHAEWDHWYGNESNLGLTVFLGLGASYYVRPDVAFTLQGIIASRNESEMVPAMFGGTFGLTWII